MQRTILSLFMTVVVMVVFCLPASAQNRERERPAPKPFMEKLWYGGNFGLGFFGGNQTSQFNLGLYPMVGYKIIPWFSVGPRLGFEYNYYKAPGVNPSFNVNIASTNIFTFYTGVFARSKIYRWIFAQAEYGVSFGKQPYLINGYLELDDNNKVVKSQVSQESGLIGLGYNSGDIIATEVMLLYDVLVPTESYQNPWNFRFGLTYKF